MLSLDDAYQEALRGGVWVERPPALRLIRLTGDQRIWFLQNTITADVEEVSAGRWVESLFLDAKGRVQAHFRAGILRDEVWLDVEPDAGPALAEWFERYRFRTNVTIEPVQRRCVSVLGPAAAELSNEGSVIERDGGVVFGDRLGDVAIADIHAFDRPMLDVPQAPFEFLDVLRVEAGVGSFGIDFGTRDLPQEAGLTRVVPVDRGCYVGQETIARIHFRGHVNKVVRTLSFESSLPEAGADLRWEGRSAGRVTSTALSPRKGPIGLGMVRVEPPAGATLEVEGGGTATLGPIPEGTKVKIS